MKKFALSVIISAMAISCGTSQKISQAGDGSDYSKAVVVSAKNETDGVAKEYEWLKTNYPGSQVISQGLGEKNGKPFDIFRIKTASGEEKSVYFDISRYFGKF